MSARTATQAMAVIRLAMGEAAEPLLQVIHAKTTQAEGRASLKQLRALSEAEKKAAFLNKEHAI